MKRIALFALLLCALPMRATTYYIRSDGGVRYVASGGGGNTPYGGCNGTTDAAYPGTTNRTWFPNHAYSLGTQILDNVGTYETVTTAGTSGSAFWPSWGATTVDGTVHWTQGASYPINQNCAYDDFRFLYDNQAYNGILSGWVIAGGDHVLIRGCFDVDENEDGSTLCRIGGSPPGNTDYWCVGQSVIACSSSAGVPSGTGGAHTQILGQNYASCATGGKVNPMLYSTQLTQIFGGAGVGTILNMIGSQYVDLQCIEITDHASCAQFFGSSPAYPHQCTSADDWAVQGIAVGTTTGNTLFQDVWIHGLGTADIYGPVGTGPETLLRVNTGFSMYGWQMQNGADDPNGATSDIEATHVFMEGEGCNQEYPIVHSGFPAVSCYDQNSAAGAAVGDSWSGQNNNSVPINRFFCNDCNMFYNTKDGFVGPHVPINTLIIENSASYGNMGQQWKWGLNTNGTGTFINNLTIGGCAMMNSQVPGAGQNFNLTTGLPGSYLSLYCRAAGDVFSFFGSAGSSMLFANSTVVAYSSTVFDETCGATNTCSTSTFDYTNMLYLGYTAPTSEYSGAPGTAPGLYYQGDPSVTFTISHNLEFGLRNGTCPTGSLGMVCSDSLLTGEPAQAWPGTAELAFQNFNYHPSVLSPAISAGTTYSGQPTVDYYDDSQTSPLTLGAVVYTASPTSRNWYVDVAIGGTRYSVNETSGLCDGTLDAAPVGSTPNQHCAFSDVRYFWTDGSYVTNSNAGSPAWGWMGSGGDHYHIIGCTASGTAGCRIGQSGPNSGDYFGLAGNPYGAGAPPPLSGSSGAHTTISGPSAGSKAFLNGGYGVNPALTLAGVSYVDIANIDLTQLSSCGRSAQTNSCNTNFPLSDYATTGIAWNNTTTNTTMTDVNVHGISSVGMIGATGDGDTVTRVTLSGNGGAGWNMDDGSGQTGTGHLTLSYLNLILNGCKEVYPITTTLAVGTANGGSATVGAAADCTDDNIGGYGDGIGTATVASSPGWIMSIDHSTAAYNTQDGFDLLHLHGSSSQLNITQSIAYGNMGQQLKAGSDGSNVTNNLLITNCNALRQAIPGLPSGYNSRLSDFCRAADSGVALGINDGTTLAFDFNTIYSASSTAIELDCTSSCSTTALVDWRNNVFVGFLNNTANGYPGGGTGDYSNPIFYAVTDPFTNAGSLYANNATYHPKSTWTCPATGESNALCASPQLTDMTWHLYGFGNMQPTSGAAVIAAGVTIGGITTDYLGNPRNTPPTMGAYEGTFVPPTTNVQINGQVTLGGSVTVQ